MQRLDETMQVADPHDQPFVDLAMSAGVDALVSGDAHVLALVGRGGLRVMRPDEFRRWFEVGENCGADSGRSIQRTAFPQE